MAIDFTFKNGRKISEERKYSFGLSFTVSKYEHEYDNKGKRTITIETHSELGKRQYTRTYNSDGTLQKVTYPIGFGGTDNTIVTNEFIWEDGKKTWDEDDFFFW